MIKTIREVKHHVYVKRQTRICTTWPSFPFACRLLFIISRHKLVVSRNFFSRCFCLLIFYLNLIFAVSVNVKLKLSLITSDTRIKKELTRLSPILNSLRKQSKFCDAATRILAKWCLKNRHRNSILLKHVTTQIWVVLLISHATRETFFNQSEATPRPD